MDIIRLPDQLGTMLRAARVQKGLTQADVARQLGVSVQALSKLESNAGRASFDRVHRLCLLLGLDIALLPKADDARSTDTRRSEW
ncbi:MAG TPA: helix-turn-helix transcriptional regulator [Dyella sp.]|uniref:helix-turn-helix domain-containing protein n=1 Tax=Dyella sp. TaxID=1869338 RepID=UPI002D787C70|nr:helix-turn-helix transcriptional regulator [Dyella sp.]HET6554798.1 helix-turn-helix transcriptional regulator [Dyella sp.]